MLQQQRPGQDHQDLRESKLTEEEAARERSPKGWDALHALERKQSAFSWWPGQESEVFHTQTRLPGN
eukprot:11128958-Prorocentrum_lima.AAC.1